MDETGLLLYTQRVHSPCWSPYCHQKLAWEELAPEHVPTSTEQFARLPVIIGQEARSIPKRHFLFFWTADFNTSLTLLPGTVGLPDFKTHHARSAGTKHKAAKLFVQFGTILPERGLIGLNTFDTHALGLPFAALARLNQGFTSSLPADRRDGDSQAKNRST